jgi:hypothetical protein
MPTPCHCTDITFWGRLRAAGESHWSIEIIFAELFDNKHQEMKSAEEIRIILFNVTQVVFIDFLRQLSRHVSWP